MCVCVCVYIYIYIYKLLMVQQVKGNYFRMNRSAKDFEFGIKFGLFLLFFYITFRHISIPVRPTAFEFW